MYACAGAVFVYDETDQLIKRIIGNYSNAVFGGAVSGYGTNFVVGAYQANNGPF